jgi:hypothetical protein
MCSVEFNFKDMSGSWKLKMLVEITHTERLWTDINFGTFSIPTGVSEEE